MSSWDSADTEECDDIFMSMFTHRDAKDEKFYFKDIIISQDSLTFKFSFCNEIDFNSVVLLDMPLDERNLNVMRTVFSIGMCVCSWYWMGYYTPYIIISQNIVHMCGLSVDMMRFWEVLYHNISLEYVFVNKIPYQHLTFLLDGGDQNIHPDAGLLVSDSKRTPKHSVIIPMGGTSLPRPYQRSDTR